MLSAASIYQNDSRLNRKDYRQALMKGEAEMVRMSMLRNCPVICRDRQIGLLQSICFDEAQKTVQALVVAGGLKGKCMVKAEEIESLTKEFILIDSVGKYSRRNETSPFRFVRDTRGALLGRVTDYLLDEDTLSVAALEIMRGYLPGERHARLWAFSYCASSRCPDEAIIAVSFSAEPSDWKEEACT